jgi:DNA-binding winged helix-turn-helix (wHTH) protein/Tol biopolymer transport system component
MPGSFSTLYRFEEFELDPARRTFVRNGIPVSISQKAFEVLTYLVSNPGRVITKDELLKAVWPESFVEEGNLTQNVFVLRKAMGDKAGCIVTIAGRGYQFTAQVQEAMQELALPSEQRGHAEDDIVQPINERAQVVMQESSPAVGQPLTDRRLGWLPWSLAIAAVVVLVAFIVLRLNRPSTLRISTYEQITHDGGPKSIGGTDGSRIYLTGEQPHTIAEVSISGGLVEPIQVPLNEPWAGDVSPDGSSLLIISESGGMGPANSLWSFRLVGGSLRRLASSATESAWSPDGSRVAYCTVTGDIFVVRSDGTGERKLASPAGFIRSLGWSHDGSKLRFSKDGQLWELSADGSNLHQLLLGWNSSSEFSGQWAQDGRYYLVSDGQIWALDDQARFGRIRASKPVQLTFGPIGWDRPVLSRDGRKLLATGHTRRGQLVRFDAPSKQFKPFLGGISAEFVAFTSDGKTVAYVTYPGGILWRANADGSNPLQLTSPPIYPKSLRWSPDGTQILFVDRTPKGTNGIYTIASNGGTPSRVLPNDNDNETDPSWSPDGKRIAYSTCPNLGVCSKSDLRILDRASGKAEMIPGSDGLVAPRWSPDGRFISAMTLDSMSMKVLNMESGKWSPLNTGSIAFPEWSHDSKFIYYLRWKGDAALARISPGEAMPEILAVVNNENFTGYFTSWMGLDNSHAPLLLRDIGSDDIYALTLEGK